MFMTLVQTPECGGFNLTWADRLRKSIAKKNPKEFDQLTEEYYNNIKEKNLSYNLCNYVWKVLVAYSRGYGFNKSHTLAYSLIALQEMNLAYKYPIIFWNCACLISDAGGNEEEDEIDEEAIEENKVEEDYPTEMENFDEEEDVAVGGYDEDEGSDGYPVEVKILENGKKKKKTKNTNYGKVASAIGKIKSTGVKIVAPDINESTYTFSPDVEQNCIRYGISGITRIGEDLIKAIISNRPYSSIEDFLNKVKLTKPQMINLIKAGAFDKFGERVAVMKQYVGLISDTKKRLNLQNMKMLMDFGLIPESLDFERRVYNYNKYLKGFKEDNYFLLNNIAFKFFENNFDVDLLVPAPTESGFKIDQKVWDKIYQKKMDPIRNWIKQNQQDLLDKVNNKLTEDIWNKYCLGTISKWEMDSISCYIHQHELTWVDNEKYGFSDFFNLPENPEIDRYIPIKGKDVPLFKLRRIAGTVLDRDKSKKLVTLLTTSGVVTVKIYGGVFAQYDKQISQKGADGHKHIIEKSMFSRGNKIIVTGVRQEDSFLAKTYAKTKYHKVEQIVEVNNGQLTIKAERAEAS